MTKYERTEFEKWLAEYFEYNEDAIIFNIDDKELFKQFKEESKQ